VLQSLPFRLEIVAERGDGPAAAAAPAAGAAPAEDAAFSKDAPLADVVIGLDSERGLDVTIATGTRQAADRVEAGRGELLRELAALGAEVEAIRVELRPEREPDGGGHGAERGRSDAGDATSGTAAGPGRADPGGQEGQGMRDRSDRNEGHRNEQGSRSWQLVPRGAGDAGGSDATAGKVDRYA
jgi:hypothetical protein